MMAGARVGQQEAPGVYPERADRKENAFDRWTRTTSGRVLLRLRPFGARLRSLAVAAGKQGSELRSLDDEQIRSRMREGARRAMQGGELAGALALVREAARRSLGLEPFDTQLMGAATLMSGKLAEMQTGEGKTLTAALAACIGAAANVPVHIVTVNDYLAERDAIDMRPLFDYFGLSVGVITSGLSLDQRRAAYACHITYCTNKELVFDYLKDRVAAGGRATRAQMQMRAVLGDRKQSAILLRGLHFAIVDEADSIMIDEARTPLILAEKGIVSSDESYRKALDLARAMQHNIDYEIISDRHHLHLTIQGKSQLREWAHELGSVWQSGRAREHLVAQALRALHLFHKDQQYLVDSEQKVQIIDEYTGRVLDGRTWEQGLHQLIEMKEGVPLSEQNRTLARITYQRFFPRYLRLAGMTGTASEVKAELFSVYGLEVVAIPTHRKSRRIVFPAVCLPDESSKWNAVADEATTLSRRGAPVLIGTRSLEASERLSAVLTRAGLAHRVLNARQDADEAAIISVAGEKGMVTVATNMAGRGTDIRLGEGAREAGGLHVILTEFHDSQRIDRQLVGRGARQGDPGSTVSIVSRDDDLLLRNGGLLLLLMRALWSGNLSGPALALLRRMAQRSTAANQARERRDTLAQDQSVDTLLSFAGNQI